MVFYILINFCRDQYPNEQFCLFGIFIQTAGNTVIKTCPPQSIHHIHLVINSDHNYHACPAYPLQRMIIVGMALIPIMVHAEANLLFFYKCFEFFFLLFLKSLPTQILQRPFCFINRFGGFFHILFAYNGRRTVLPDMFILYPS